MAGKNHKKTSIAVTSMKGGTGKTTIALNTAEYFSRKVDRVLVIDVDPQINSCQYFTSEESLLDKDQVNLYDILTFIIKNATHIYNKEDEVNTELENLFLRSLIHRDNMSVIASNPDIPDIEAFMQSSSATTYLMAVLFQVAQRFYDVIVIDCPPTINMEIVKSVYICVKNIVVPTEATKLSYYNLMKVFRWYLTVKRVFNPGLNLAGIIVSKYDKRKKLQKLVYDTMVQDEDVGKLILYPPIALLTDFEKSLHINRYVGDYSPNDQAAKIFIEVMHNLEKGLVYE
jgi:chromosome partitioning protein